MTPVTRLALESLVRLQADQDFINVTKWLEQELEDSRDSLEACNADKFGFYQGYAAAFRKVLDTASRARDVVDKVRTRESR